MPEISRFYGIIIRLYFDDHSPPHFHAEYGEDEALRNIHTLAIISGHLPGRAFGLVVEWALLHQEELIHLWGKAQNKEALGKINPLR